MRWRFQMIVNESRQVRESQVWKDLHISSTRQMVMDYPL